MTDKTIPSQTDGGLLRDTDLLAISRSATPYKATPGYIAVQTSYKKSIVIVGSSTVAGVGASDAAHSWVGLLFAAMQSNGWTTRNAGVSGDNSAAVISRFYTDVAAYAPNIVMVGLTYGNEISSGDEIDYNRMVSNLRQLVRMIRLIGAVPVMGGPFPRNALTTAEKAYSAMLASELNSMGVPWVCYDSLDDGTGSYISSCSDDGTHPNNVGHAEMYHCTPISMFDALLFSQKYLLPTTNGALKLTTTTPTTNPILYTPTTAITSFTAFFRIKMTSSILDNSYFGVGTNTVNAIRNKTGNTGFLSYTPTSGSDIVSSVAPATDMAWHSITLTYNTISGTTTFYVDGISIGTASETLTPASFALGSIYGKVTFTQNCQFKDFVILRTALLPGLIKQIHNGSYSKGSLEFHSPLNVADVKQPHIINEMGTDSFSVIDTTTNLWTGILG